MVLEVNMNLKHSGLVDIPETLEKFKFKQFTPPLNVSSGRAFDLFFFPGVLSVRIEGSKKLRTTRVAESIRSKL